MSGLNPCLLSFCILGCMLCSSRAWDVKMPSNIIAHLGSCVVIPCTYDYFKNPPRRPDRVVWYQYVTHGYPLVYDSWHPNDVIDIFRHKTRAVSFRHGKECSLQIKPVKWHHHRQKIYPWVDPENVGRGTYRFFDKTVTIQVVDQAAEPDIMISGDLNVGQSVTVQCTAYHTCPTEPPTLSLNVPLLSPTLQHTVMSEGTTKTTLTTTMTIVDHKQTVECSVRHSGGLSAKNIKTLNAKCSVSPLTIKTEIQEFFEGQLSKVTCTASYTCPQHVPTLTWNYGKMAASTNTVKIGSAQWRTVSELTFTASASDHGGFLACYARFADGTRQEVGLTLHVKRNMLSRGWSFSTPASIQGMRGSCIIIPCTFTYSSSQPAGLRVIWYLLQGKGYPPVYDQKQTVTGEYRGKTSLIGSVGEGNCSLKIERLEMSHNGDRVYPWVDSNPITSYHTLDYSFYEKTSQLIVLDHAQQPQMSVFGIPRVGEGCTVSCRVRHTCITAPPMLSFSGIPGKDNVIDTLGSDGIWERTLERTWTVKEDDQSVKCTVSYPGAQTATSELRLNVECPFEDMQMTERPGELTEGVAHSVICSVSYKCKKNQPAITWNFKDMQQVLHTEQISSDTYKKVSNLTFIGSMVDDGKPLNCTAQFISGETSASETLHIKRYENPLDNVYPHDDHTLSVLAADVPFRLSALTRSCVVIPCSFQNQEHLPMTRGIWAKKSGGIVYHNGRSNVLDHFKDRTRLLGDLNQGNCSLEVDDIKPFDNGPFCFYAEREDTKFKFNNSCIFIVMKASPDKPVIGPLPAEADVGSMITVSCSAKHTCPSRGPEFTWSVPVVTSQVSHTQTAQGIWETISEISFVVAEGDGAQNLTCTAKFWGGKQEASTVKLNVKGTGMYRFRKSIPIVIPVLALVLFAVIGVVIWMKRRRSPVPPPRPEKRRSLWDRLSRRYPDSMEKPPRPEKPRVSRGSIWSRFSRNNSPAANCDSHFSKQRFPSPKNNQRAPWSVGSEDSQLYSNI